MKNERVGPKFKTLLVLIIISAIMFCFSIVVYAAGSNFQKPSMSNRYKVYSGGSTYTPNQNSYPFNSKNVTAIGFDSLYGSSKGFWKYLGEVPNKIANQSDWSSFRAYNGNKIDGVERKWSNQDISKDNLKPNSKDIHIYAMTYSNDWFGDILGTIGLAFVSGLNWLFQQLVNLMITIKSFNLADMVSAIDQGGSLSKTLSLIFLIDIENGNISPLMLFGLLCFVGSLAAMAFKALRGDLSIRKISSELGFFVLAITITATFFTTTNASTMARIGTDFMTKLANNVTGSAADSTSIFIYDTGNESMDNSNTQRSLIKKTYIDQMINAQFGYNVNDLYIQKADGTSSFGDISIVKSALEKTFKDGNIDSMAVSTDNDGDYKINNLGYYLWAANTNVGIYAGKNGVKSQKNDKSSFYQSGEKTLFRMGSSDRTLFVIDFLNNVKNADGQTNEIKMKVDNILNHLCNPSYATAITNVLLVAVQNIVLSIASFTIILFTALGQLIITLGSFCMVVMPMLLVYGPTRSVASRMMYTYLLGFLRYLVGSALFNALICTTTILSQQGFGGILVSTIICGVMGKYGPVLIKELNMAMTSLGKGKELRFMNHMYYGMDSHLNKWQGKINDRRANRFVMNKNGEMVKDQSFSEKVQSGLSKEGLTGTLGRGKDAFMSYIPGTEEYNAKVNDRNVNIDNNQSADLDQPLNINQNDDGNHESIKNVVQRPNKNFNVTNVEILKEEQSEDKKSSKSSINKELNNISANNKKEKKAKDYSTLKRNATNIGMKTASHIPIIGEILNHSVAKSVNKNQKLKKDIKEKIAKVISESDSDLSINDAYEHVADQLKADESMTHLQKIRIEKQMNKAKNKITKGDVNEIVEKANTLKLNKPKKDD